MGSSRPALVAEAFGTFLFLFVGAGSVVLSEYVGPAQTWPPAQPCSAWRWRMG